MKNQGFKLQAFGICCIAMFGIAVTMRTVMSGPEAPVHAAAPKPDPEFQIDVLAQEAAIPGKVIHARQQGENVLTYVCKPDDAAVALFTMRDKLLGKDLNPSIVDATDRESRRYVAHVESYGHVKLIAVKRGFSERPDSIDVTLRNGNVLGTKRSDIRFTRIAEPSRVLWQPSASEAQAAEKVVQATVNDNLGFVEMRLLEPYSPTENDTGTFLALSFTKWNPSEPVVSPNVTPTYCKAIDATKIRVDRFRTVSSETTLTYKNASIVQTNGKNFLLLPTVEHIGSIWNHRPIMGNHLPIGHSWPLDRKNAKTNQQIEIRWDSDVARKSGDEKNQSQANEGLSLKVLDVWPSVASMGLNSLQVVISKPQFLNGPTTEYTKSFDAGQRPPHAVIRAIPELRLRMLVTTHVKVSSRTFVIPVHHVTTRVRGRLATPMQPSTSGGGLAVTPRLEMRISAQVATPRGQPQAPAANPVHNRDRP